MESEHAESSTAEIKSEEEDIQMTSIPPILHNDHSPSICALQVQTVFERYQYQEKHLMDVLARNCKQIEENGRLTVENLRGKQELRTSASKIAELQEDKQKLETELMTAKDKVRSLQKAQLDASVVKEDVQFELDQIKAAKDQLAHKLECLKTELAVEKETTARANQKLKEAMETNIGQREAAVRCMQEAKQYADQEKQELVNQYVYFFKCLVFYESEFKFFTTHY